MEEKISKPTEETPQEVEEEVTLLDLLQSIHKELVNINESLSSSTSEVELEVEQGTTLRLEISSGSKKGKVVRWVLVGGVLAIVILSALEFPVVLKFIKLISM